METVYKEVSKLTKMLKGTSDAVNYEIADGSRDKNDGNRS